MLREKVAFLPHELPLPLQDFVAQVPAAEAVILSTCNRTEFYYYAEAEQMPVFAWLENQRHLSTQQLQPHFYHYDGAHALQHLLRVATGIDSMVLGEPQILGQVKEAYRVALAAGTVGGELSKLFQYVFSVAKRVRQHTDIGKHPVSVASIAVDLVKKLYPAMQDLHVLLIGSGDTIALAAKHLHQQNIKNITIANRHLERAQQLATVCGGNVVAITEIPNCLHQVDVVISATACPLPIISKANVQAALEHRQAPLLMIDLAVPHDIEPNVRELPTVQLYNIDDLQEMVAGNRQERATAAIAAEQLITQGAEEYFRKLAELQANDLIKSYRAKTVQLSEQMLQQARKELQQGVAAEEVLQRFAHGLIHKIMHAPTAKMREASYQQADEVLQAAQYLLDLV